MKKGQSKYQKLKAWCADNGVRFIYASSAATYGDGSQGFRDDEDPEKLSALRPLKRPMNGPASRPRPRKK